jgi:hypothetical protein
MATPARRERTGPALSPQSNPPDVDRLRREAERVLSFLLDKVKELEDRVYALENP